ncbi:MAG: phage head closure protein [Devosia sp.]
MRAGQLDRRIQITRTTTAPNLDEPWMPGVPTTIVIASVRAALVQQSTEEFMRSFGESQVTAAVFRIRYRSDVELTDQVIFDGATYDLVETNEIGRRNGLELRAKVVS